MKNYQVVMLAVAAALVGYGIYGLANGAEPNMALWSWFIGGGCVAAAVPIIAYAPSLIPTAGREVGGDVCINQIWEMHRAGMITRHTANVAVQEIFESPERLK